VKDARNTWKEFAKSLIIGSVIGVALAIGVILFLLAMGDLK
jgi:hypothetical protein